MSRIPYCDWGVSDDILEMIGKQIVEVKETRYWAMCKSHFKSMKMTDEFKAIVNVLAKRNKPLTLRNMRYKYVQRDEVVRRKGISRHYDWNWRTSLEERRNKIHRKELLDRIAEAQRQRWINSDLEETN